MQLFFSSFQPVPDPVANDPARLGLGRGSCLQCIWLDTVGKFVSGDAKALSRKAKSDTHTHNQTVPCIGWCMLALPLLAVCLSMVWKQSIVNHNIKKSTVWNNHNIKKAWFGTIALEGTDYKSMFYYCWANFCPSEELIFLCWANFLPIRRAYFSTCKNEGF